MDNDQHSYRFGDRAMAEFTMPNPVIKIINSLIDYLGPNKIKNVVVTYPKLDVQRIIENKKIQPNAKITLVPSLGRLNENNLAELKLPKQTKLYSFETEQEIQNVINDINDIDFLVSVPPFGYNKKLRIKLDAKQLGLDEDYLLSRLNITEGLFALMLQKLTDDGIAILVVPNYIYHSSGFIDVLNIFGVSIKANIVLPKIAFPQTAAQINLLFITKKPSTKNMLVLKIDTPFEIDDIASHIEYFLETGKTKIGDIVESNNFKGYQSLKINKVVEKQIKQSGYDPVNILSDQFATEIAAIKDDEKPALNSIYIPKIGRSPVLVNLTDSKLKNPKNYYKITFKEDAQLNIEYIANYLNSYVGVLIRESKFVGSVIPSMSLSSLREEGLYIPLPEIKEQLQIIGLHRDLTAVAEQATEFQSKLWNYPASHAAISQDAKELIKKAPEDAWTEELPYPLASILKRFYNENDLNKRYDLLLHFFEATSELLTAIHLGAYVSDQALYEKFKSDTEVGKKLPSVVSSSNFGGWILFLNDSNKFIKRVLSIKDSDYKANILSAFGTASEDFLQKVVDSSITNTLEKAVNLRNGTKGHGPYVDIPESIYESSLQLLADMKKPLLAIFSNLSLIAYDSSTNINEAEIRYDVKVLKGSNPILPNKSIVLATSRILTNEFVYIYSEIEESVIKLSSLVKLGPLPKDKKVGFYFYNAKSKWKSYEFESEISSDDSIIYKELQI